MHLKIRAKLVFQFVHQPCGIDVYDTNILDLFLTSEPMSGNAACISSVHSSGRIYPALSPPEQLEQTEHGSKIDVRSDLARTNLAGFVFWKRCYVKSTATVS
jgi:hypothetical protein